MISGLRSELYEDRLKELGLTSLEERRHRADMALVHSVMHGRTDISTEDWFERADTGIRATRTKDGHRGPECAAQPNMAALRSENIFSQLEQPLVGTMYPVN